MLNNTDNVHNDHTDHSDEDSSDIDKDEDDTRGAYVNEDVDDNIKSKPDLWRGYMNLGPPTKKCTKCNAIMWNEERNNKYAKKSLPTFSICCRDGQVKLDKDKQPPAFLASLIAGGAKHKHYMDNIRSYNSMFQFTSLGGKIDRSVNNGSGPYCFKLFG